MTKLCVPLKCTYIYLLQEVCCAFGSRSSINVHIVFEILEIFSILGNFSKCIYWNSGENATGNVSTFHSKSCLLLNYELYKLSDRLKSTWSLFKDVFLKIKTKNAENFYIEININWFLENISVFLAAKLSFKKIN